MSNDEPKPGTVFNPPHCPECNHKWTILQDQDLGGDGLYHCPGCLYSFPDPTGNADPVSATNKED